MNDNKNNRIVALVVTLLVHLLVALLLWLIHLHCDLPAEEDGVLVLVGDVRDAHGNDRIEAVGEADVSGASEPQTVPSEPVPAAQPTPVREQPLIAQNEEPAPAIAAQQKRKKEEEARRAEERRKAEAKAKADAQAKADAEAKKRAEAEARRKAEEEARRAEEARKAEEERRALVRSRLGNLSGGDSGNSQGQGAQGSNVGGNQGNPQGQGTGVGTQGTHSGSGISISGLHGRGVVGDLRRPSYHVNASGVVVVSVTVDPSGNVTSATVRPTGTTTTNTSLRNAAIAAARQTKFQPMSGQISQGTITYTFDSDN